MFHVAIILTFFHTLTLTQSIPLKFQNPSLSLQLSSTRYKDQIQMLISVNGTLNSQFKIETKAFKHQHGSHNFILKDQEIQIYPRMNDQEIVFNYRVDGQYLMAMVHRVDDLSDKQFMAMKVSNKDGEGVEILLPIFDWKISQIYVENLYRCHNVLISAEVDNEKQAIYFNFFTNDKKQSTWLLQGEWDHQWRHSHQNTYIGGAHRKLTKQPIKILLSNAKYCLMRPQNLQKQSSQKTATSSKQQKTYYTVDDLLNKAPVLQQFKEKKVQINQEL